jgi:hypothetical protein
MENGNEIHDLSQLILFYQIFGNSAAEDDVTEAFEEMQEIAEDSISSKAVSSSRVLYP